MRTHLEPDSAMIGSVAVCSLSDVAHVRSTDRPFCAASLALGAPSTSVADIVARTARLRDDTRRADLGEYASMSAVRVCDERSMGAVLADRHPDPFDSPTISSGRSVDFATQPHDGCALIEGVAILIAL
jgi:hypothetical protein